MRVYSTYMTAASIEAVKGIKTQWTLDNILCICDSIDQAHNDEPIIVSLLHSTATTARDSMNLISIETRFQALWSKEWQMKGNQEQLRTGSKLSCFECSSKDHLIHDCKDPRKNSRVWKPQEGKALFG